MEIILYCQIGLEKGLESMTAFGGKTLGTKTHEKVGEEFLQKLGFPKSVTDFVRGHVSAKRYLVFKYVLKKGLRTV